jgi:hypothetical protein
MPLDPETIKQACRLIAKSRYDSVMQEAEEMSNTLQGIKIALQEEGCFELTVAIIERRLTSWWKCKNRETELFPLEVRPADKMPEIKPIKTGLLAKIDPGAKDPDLSPA